MIKLSILLIFCHLGISSFCQTYTVEVLEQPYVFIEETVSLTNDEVWDDPTFVIPFGFNIDIFSEEINEITLGGYGATLFTGDPYAYDALTIVLPFEADVIDRSQDYYQGLSEISHITQGISGSQVKTIQWDNVGFYGDTTLADFANFQARFFENTGVIEVHIGPNSVLSPFLSFDGQTGPGIGLVESFDPYSYVTSGEIVMLNGAPLNPNISSSFDFYAYDWGLDSTPPENTLYRFTPAAVGLIENTELSLSIFPNPADEEFYIQGLQNETFAFSIVDITGREVAKGFSSGLIQVDEALSGTYVLILNKDGVTQQELIILR